jgi:hypothetical protein
VWDDIDASPGAEVFVNCSINCNTTRGDAALPDSCRLAIKLVNSSGQTSDDLQFNCGEDGDGYFSRTRGRLGNPTPKTLKIPPVSAGTHASTAQKWTLVATFIQRASVGKDTFDAYVIVAPLLKTLLFEAWWSTCGRAADRSKRAP